MMMQHQNQNPPPLMELFPKPDSPIETPLSLLHLSSSSTFSTDPSQVNPMKRPFPFSSSSSSISDPILKKPSPIPALNLPGFNVLQLPSSPNQQQSKPPEFKAAPPQGLPPLPNQLPLWRSASDPTPFPSNVLDSPTQAIEASRRRVVSGLGPWCRGVATSPDGLDLTGIESPNGIKRSPGRAVAAGSGMRSIGCSENGSGFDVAENESPASKRLRRMSVRMREMKQWFDEVINEDDDDQGSLYQAAPNNSTQKDGSYHCCAGGDHMAKSAKGRKLEQEGVTEDALVSAERDGESIVVHFKCPCGSGYHFLISGKSCYYKLL